MITKKQTSEIFKAIILFIILLSIFPIATQKIFEGLIKGVILGVSIGIIILILLWYLKNR